MFENYILKIENKSEFNQNNKVYCNNEMIRKVRII